MALYRNIAGVNNSQIGLALNLKDYFTPPNVPVQPETPVTPPATGGGLVVSQPNVVQILPPGTQWGSGTNIVDSYQQIQGAFSALAAAKQGYYNYLLTTSPVDLTSAGYYVSDSGDVYVFTDATHRSVYLALQDIQDIENNAGTAGTLFMHLGLPVMAKDTAGYAGGGRASQGATTMYSMPIADVLAIPATPTGANVINDYNPPQPATPIITPINNGVTGNSVTTATTSQPSGTTLSFAAIGLAVIGLIGGKKLLMAGGLGLLYFSMMKSKNS